MKPLRYLGDPILQTRCKPVEKITAEIRKIRDELIDTMIAHNGSGLAAPQIGYDVQMFAIQLSDQVDKKYNPYDAEPTVFINPKITRMSKETIILGEGCLSVPGLYVDIERPREIDFEALDIEGNVVVEKNLKRWRGRCVQHEIDHLNGILFIERFSPEERKKHEHTLRHLEMQYRSGALNKKPFGF